MRDVRCTEKGSMNTEDTCKSCGHTYQRLPRAKSKLCCSCRKIKIEAKKSVSRMVANDPPAFQTQKELDEWYSHDALRCHICGGNFPGLYRHVSLAHGITARDYKLRFGIPLTYGLAGRTTRQKHAACGCATSVKMSVDGYANLSHARTAKTGTRVAWAPYQAAIHASRMIKSPNHPSNFEGEMELTCRECGDAYEVPASIGLSKQCVAKCPTCRKAGKKLANHTRSEAL